MKPVFEFYFKKFIRFSTINTHNNVSQGAKVMNQQGANAVHL